jgi:ferredoxin
MRNATHLDGRRPGERGAALTKHMNVLLISLRDRIAAGGGSAVKVQISSDRCQGHGRCYDLAPGLFGEDGEGYGRVLSGEAVPPAEERGARLAVANCPEYAVEILEES